MARLSSLLPRMGRGRADFQGETRNWEVTWFSGGNWLLGKNKCQQRYSGLRFVIILLLLCLCPPPPHEFLPKKRGSILPVPNESPLGHILSKWCRRLKSDQRKKSLFCRREREEMEIKECSIVDSTSLFADRTPASPSSSPSCFYATTCAMPWAPAPSTLTIQEQKTPCICSSVSLRGSD